MTALAGVKIETWRELLSMVKSAALQTFPGRVWMSGKVARVPRSSVGSGPEEERKKIPEEGSKL